jgi:branched-chain amino acid transport system ATP-binding protein
VPWLLRDEASILALIGLSAQADLPAGATTPSQQRLLEIGMALATRPRCCCSTRWRPD